MDVRVCTYSWAQATTFRRVDEQRLGGQHASVWGMSVSEAAGVDPGGDQSSKPSARVFPALGGASLSPPGTNSIS